MTNRSEPGMEKGASRASKLARQVALIAFVGAIVPCADGSPFLSSIGSLSTPESVFELTFNLSAPAALSIRTWSFGGGTNAAGQIIPAGGFDPLVALFSGPVATASIVTIGGNPAADADTLLSFTGNCPPAGFVVIGTGTGNTICGDDLLQTPPLAAGVYTLVLTDANFIPLAVDPGPPGSTLLSDGFSDLTGGVFQTCNSTGDGTFCITPTNNFAVDVRASEGASLTVSPEPGTLLLSILGLALVVVSHRLKLRPDGRFQGGKSK